MRIVPYQATLSSTFNHAEQHLENLIQSQAGTLTESFHYLES